MPRAAVFWWACPPVNQLPSDLPCTYPTPPTSPTTYPTPTLHLPGNLPYTSRATYYTQVPQLPDDLPYTYPTPPTS
jgi:hypothetical protein